MEVIKKNLTASTWHELETNGKFGNNAKLSFINANQELKTLKTMAAAMLANTWNKSPALERTKEPV